MSTRKVALAAINAYGATPPSNRARNATQSVALLKFGFENVMDPLSGNEPQLCEPQVHTQFSERVSGTSIPILLIGRSPIQSPCLAFSYSKSITTSEPKTTHDGVVRLPPLTTGAMSARMIAAVRIMVDIVPSLYYCPMKKVPEKRGKRQ